MRQSGRRARSSLLFQFATGVLGFCLCVARLSADNLTYDLSGSLTAMAANESGAPIIRAHPCSLVAPTNAVVVFAVVAAGTPPLAYQWQLNSNNLSGATAGTLFVTNIGPADFGAYRVMVSNALGSVTSSNALLQLDSDRDGMADSWETNYFTSITNRSGFEDYDQDGVSDRDEFLEGTQPRFASVLNPRLTIISDNGEVFVAPNVPLFTNGQTVTLTGVPDPGLQFLGYLANAPSYAIVAIRTNPAQVRLTSSLTVRAIFGLPISHSLDVTNGGRIDQAGWFGQAHITHDGVDAMQSARMLGVPEAWLELTNVVLAGEGTITFWWKVDGTPVDELRFYRNNTLRSGAIGTNTDWQLRTYYLPAGTNAVRWVYRKYRDEVSEYNGLFYAPEDAGWVDEVSYAVWPDPLLDADADGLPDLWEFRYFDGIGPAPNADADGDGISNLEEYLDGTIPDNNASFLPRLTVITTGAEGAVLRDPDLSKYTLGQTVQLEAVPDPTNYFVIWSGAVSGTNTTNSILMNNNKTITAVFGSPLPAALDTPLLGWIRDGEIGWFGQTNFSRDGVAAAQTGPVGFNQHSAMETAVAGPGTLLFWWKASSATNQSFARFLVDGVEQPERISGRTDWRVQSYYLDGGTHTLRWVYTNRTGLVSLTNGAWVDQLEFTPGTIAPTIFTQPADAVALQGSDAVFTVIAGGTPPLTYQWFRNGASLGAAGTNAILTLSYVAEVQGGSYSVQVGNSVHTVASSNATLSVLPIPPENDDFASRAALTAANAVLGYTFGATKEPGEPDHASTFGGRSVWWSWTAPASGNYQVNVVGTNLDLLVAAVYVGDTVDALTEVESGIGTSVSTNGISLSQVTIGFSGVANTSYALAVDHSASTSGFVTVLVAPGVTPMLGDFSFSPGGPFGFSFGAVPGARYEIQGSNDLLSWTAVDLGVVPPSGVVSFTDAAAVTQPSRFYRVVLSP